MRYAHCKGDLHLIKRLSSYKNAIDKTYGDLKASIFELIETEPEDIKGHAANNQRVIINELRDKIKSIVSDELNKVQSTANRKIKGLDGVSLKTISFKSSIEINTEIDFTEALEELDVDWEDVTSWIVKTAGTAAAGATVGSAIPLVGTLAGAAVGAVVGGIIYACSGDGGKADARKSVADAIEKAKQKVRGNIASLLSSVLYEIHTQGRILRTSIEREKSNIYKLQNSLDDFDTEVHVFVKSIKHKQYGRI